MYKKIIVLILLFLNYSLHSLEHMLPQSFLNLAEGNPVANSSDTKILIPANLGALPGILEKFPADCTEGSLKVAAHVAKLTSALLTGTDQIFDNSSQKLLTRGEITAQNVSNIFSNTFTQTLIDVRNISVLTAIFGFAIYKGYEIFDTNPVKAMSYITFGFIGFLFTLKIAKQLEIAGDATLKFLTNNLTEEKLSKSISKILRRKKQKTEWEKFKEGLQNQTQVYIDARQQIAQNNPRSAELFIESQSR
ncbi:MAG: hypothetical protein P4L22_04650 [Candidatus Babeliales bacterium]|nr:hypothetical protein [Candidatus Babeliales bacterium]